MLLDMRSVSDIVAIMSLGAARNIDKDALDDRVATTAAQIDSLTQRLCTDIREMDEAAPWFTWGFLSSEHWLAFRTGMRRGQAPSLCA